MVYSDTISLWGVQIEERYVDEHLFWNIRIRNPFKMADNRLRVGINEKIIKEARRKGVHKFIVSDRYFWIPTDKMLKDKVKRGEYEDKPSIFEGSKPIRLYYFVI